MGREGGEGCAPSPVQPRPLRASPDGERVADQGMGLLLQVVLLRRTPCREGHGVAPGHYLCRVVKVIDIPLDEHASPGIGVIRTARVGALVGEGVDGSINVGGGARGKEVGHVGHTPGSAHCPEAPEVDRNSCAFRVSKLNMGTNRLTRGDVDDLGDRGHVALKFDLVEISSVCSRTENSGENGSGENGRDEDTGIQRTRTHINYFLHQLGGSEVSHLG